MAAASSWWDDPVARRLPIYLLLDCSESMVGEPLDLVNRGLQQLTADLRNDPMAAETAWLSVISFSRIARQVVPLTNVLHLYPPSLTLGPGTGLGAVFDLLDQCLTREVRRGTAERKGDWKPIIFLLTDGLPTDDWVEGLRRFRANHAPESCNIISVACGDDADMSVLSAITPRVLVMKSLSGVDFAQFFKWVSASVSAASVAARGAGGGARLPAPPAALAPLASPAASTSPKTGAATRQVILAARCRRARRGYLMRYHRDAGPEGLLWAEKAYPVGEDYFAEAAAVVSASAVDSSKIRNAPVCPYCGNLGWRVVSGGTNLECSERLELPGGHAQVMFVLDITGSMRGEIAGVREGISAFVDYIRSEQLAAEIGLIGFRDLVVGELPEQLLFDGRPFTNDIEVFKEKVLALRAKGGGGNAYESSFDALVRACRLGFEQGAERVIILITDQPPWMPDGEVRGIEDVRLALERAHVDQLYIVTPERVRGHFAPLMVHRKGQMIELGTDGRGSTALQRILLVIGKSISVNTQLG